MKGKRRKTQHAEHAAKKAEACKECGRAIPRPWEREQLEFHVPDVSECVHIVGMVRMGKSYLAKKWAEWLMKKGRPVLALDYRGEWGIDGIKRKHNSLGPLKRTVTVSEFLADPEMILATRLALAIRPDDVQALPEVKAAQFRQVLPYLRARSDDELHLFVDEVGMLAKYMAKELHDISATWGADGVRRYFVKQRWTDDEPENRAQCTKVVSFRQVKTTDLRGLAVDAGKDYARAVSQLAPREHLVANLTTVRMDQIEALEA
ncbi:MULTISPECIES: hypothetical protein [unclassified Corallococcus]|uniref:hypothetical protein n=1 Tax=unclassified Corallococcus TaxID=2685029 RepID=UPI001A8BFECC|nr:MULTISPECIES: hypothetical protein [unclassified Corallococcus]MBN9685388.1 hypothetical protein [Corallococcus sp. NCSPR001]WAS83161.1 hypothetical protein O0N60_28050 [Corallococcus sp. NCRR]